MKIIIGSESFAPNISGVATATETLARHLAQAGHQVWVFAPSRSFSTRWDKDYKEFKVLRFRSIPNPFRKNFRVSFLPNLIIARQIKKIKPDIVHLEDPTSICGALVGVAKRKKIPVVISNHFSLDYVISYVRYLKPFHPALRLFLRSHLAKFYNNCDAVICPTETNKRDLLSWGVRSQIIPISNGVDVDRFFEYSSLGEIELKYHLPKNPIVLYVGRIDKDKEIETIIDAIHPVLIKSNAHFVIAGDGAETERLKKIVTTLGVERAVSWLGWIDNSSAELPQIYQLATVFVIPSAIETQSIVTMEAMAAGLPIIGANSGALPELIKDGKNGYLFEPKDSADLADKIINILSDKKLGDKMGEKSLEIVSNHEIDKSFEKIINIYNKLIK